MSRNQSPDKLKRKEGSDAQTYTVFLRPRGGGAQLKIRLAIFILSHALAAFAVPQTGMAWLVNYPFMCKSVMLSLKTDTMYSLKDKRGKNYFEKNRIAIVCFKSDLFT